MGGKLTYPRDEIPADKTFIVTGGNTGIGYQTAKGIAKLGGKVIIACRSEERAREALEKMQKEHREEVKQEKEEQDGASKKANPPAPTTDTTKPSTTGDKDTTGEGPGDKDTTEASAEGQTTDAKDEKEDAPPPFDAHADDDIQPLKVEFMKLDLGSIASTMEFINAYKAKGYPLHVLICNAGIGLVPFQKTDDGYELQFQVNYLSHFLMTLHLLPLLRESAPNSRIINVSSIVHSAGTFDLKNMQGEVSYDRLKFYGNSKVYQIMSMYALTRRLKDSGISIFSVHPGYVDSEFTRGSADSKLHSFVESMSQVLHIKRNVEDGAKTSLMAALDTSYDGTSGIYLKDCKVANPSGLARNNQKQEELWDYSLDCLKDYITEDLLKDLQLPVPAAKDDSAPETDKPKEGTQSKTDEIPAKSEEAATPAHEAAKSKSEETEAKPQEGTESKTEEKTDESKPEVDESKSEGDEKPKSEEVESKPGEDNGAKPEAESVDETQEDKKEEEKDEQKEEAEPEVQSQSPADEGGETKADVAEVKGDEDKGEEDGEGE